MTASTLTQPTAVGLRFNPLMVAIIALAAFAAGLGVATLVPRTDTATAPAPAFNRNAFILDEHNAGAPAVFNRNGFILDEHNAGAPAPAFNRNAFILEEHNS